MDGRCGRKALQGSTLLLLLAALPLLCGAGPAPRPIGPDGRAEYRVAKLVNAGPLDILRLTQLGFDLERDADGEFIAYLTADEMTKLEKMGLAWTELPDPGLEALARDVAGAAATYHDYATLTAELQQTAADHPTITRLFSVGKTVQNREMWVMKISDNPDSAEDEPGFKFFSSMHGDEVVGMENCLRLIAWLTDRYATDARVQRLVNGAEIWIMPMYNPDGTALHQRYNAQGIDLNRNFPDMYDDPYDDPAGRAPETQNVMNWQLTHWTTLSANFHGGTLVCNYPYDNTPDGGSYYWASPDDDAFRDICIDYSENNSPMYNGSFPQGITNGADWYSITGGMQDWNYHWRGDMETTIELSNVKWPAATTLETYWNDNQESMLSYMERALTGVRGRVTDAETTSPLAATVNIVGRDQVFFTDPAVGDFHRTLMAGSYTVQAQAPGYAPATAPFSIAAPRADAVQVNLVLQPLPTNLDYSAHRVADDAGANGYLDPGETAHLAVTLRNEGRLASGVAGDLVIIDPYLQPTSGASWPNIGPGSAAESASPHFGVQVNSTTPPGHKLGAVVAWRAAGGAAGETAAFFTPVGAPATSDRPATDVPRAIPDASGSAESTIAVPTDGEIAEVNVRVDITHTYIGDLSVVLVAPDATRVRLHDHGGGSADNIHTWYDTQTRPVDDLRVLAGRSSLGTWRLSVADTAAGDVGTLDGWTLQLVTRAWENPVPEVLVHRVTRAAGKTRLEWRPVGSAQTYRVHRSTDPRSAEAYGDVTGGDPDPADTIFEDNSPDNAGSATFFIITGVGHAGEGLWGHYGR